MLGIVIGVCAVVLLVALGQGFQTSMTQTFNNAIKTVFLCLLMVAATQILALA